MPIVPRWPHASAHLLGPVSIWPRPDGDNRADISQTSLVTGLTIGLGTGFGTGPDHRVVEHLLGRQLAGDQLLGDLAEAGIVVSCVAAEDGERLIHVEAAELSEDTFRLLNGDAAGQRSLQLLVDCFLIAC